MVPHRQAAPHEQLFPTYAGFCFGGLPQRTHPALADKVSDVVNIGKFMKKYWKSKIKRKVFFEANEKKCFALMRVSKFSQIDEFPSDHLQTMQRS